MVFFFEFSLKISNFIKNFGFCGLNSCLKISHLINLCLHESGLISLESILSINTSDHDVVNEIIIGVSKSFYQIGILRDYTQFDVISGSEALDCLTSDIFFVYWHKLFSHVIDFILNELWFSQQTENWPDHLGWFKVMH